MSIRVYFTPWERDSDGVLEREVCFHIDELGGRDVRSRCGRITVLEDGDVDVTLFGDERFTSEERKDFPDTWDSVMAAEMAVAQVVQERAKKWQKTFG